jgi:hypothetical protein
MKKTILFIALFLFFSCAYSQKYWEESNISGSFDVTKTYKIAILPIVSNDAETSGEENLMKLAYNEINIQLTGVKNLQVITKQVMEETVNTYRFGGGPLSSSNYPDVAKSLSADLLVYCELSRDMGIVKKKEISTIMAYIQIFDVKNGMTAIYTSKARSINPLSKQSEVEIAVTKALNKLSEKMK